MMRSSVSEGAVNTHKLWNFLASVITLTAGTSLTISLEWASDEFFLKRATRNHIERAVDGHLLEQLAIRV